MNVIMTIITYFFDLFIIIFFLNRILEKRKRNIQPLIFYGSFLLMEIMLFLNEIITSGMSNNTALLLTSLVSLISTFLLTFLYDASLRHRIFTTLSFQIFVYFGEYIFTFIIQIIRPEIFEQEPDDSLRLFMNLGSKVFLYLICLLCVSIWKAKFSRRTLGYNILLFSTPFISVFIMMSIPIEYMVSFQNSNFPEMLYAALAILNITNYVFLDISFNRAETNHRMQQMEQQIKFQSEKYLQLSTAYKTNRSVIHDVKKHYFTINEFIKNSEYEKLEEYLNLSINDMENTYANINTGNLVIDSFVSNYKKISDRQSIEFIDNISVDPNRIPVNDYDLCIILGNILDNSINACMKNHNFHNIINLEISVNSNDTFLIYIANTFNPEDKKKTHNSSLEHGYGLENVRQIVEKHQGMLRYNTADSKDEFFELTIVIPIIETKQRLHLSNKQDNNR